ncbi:hypothetical protein FEF65_13020 [Mariprofundus erugo]|uniref:Uncharacterized protein n=1 Tax=Mariprofundus erugo TaxID=2528639 RepID=A0A5R9GFW9_9PROT|nr:hypothetical protein [Mariprofundus erugo]TLS65380.1 hypothetical protein FEF65_13020 [Mariprofundus erugo]
MGGLAVLFFVGLYIAATFWVVKRQKSGRNKIIALVIALLIPSADAIVGRIYLHHLCNTEGGLKVYRVAHGVKGFMEGELTGSDYWIKEFGYQFSEDRPLNGKVTRFSKQGDKIIREDDVDPKSLYQLLSIKHDLQGIYPRYEFLVKNIKSGDILAKYSEIGFNGGWAERFLAQFSDAGVSAVGWCTPPPWNEDLRAIAVTASLKH